MRKILFFGSDLFSIASFKELSKELNHDFQFFATYIPHGLFEKFSKQQAGINKHYVRLDDIDENFDFGIVSSFGKFIPKRIIGKFGYMLNIHPSLLPEWRGPAPIQRSIMNETGIGVSIIDVHPKIIDAGDIYSQLPLCAGNKFFLEFSDEAATMGAQIITKIIRENGFSWQKTMQNHSKSTYAADICNSDALIDSKTMKAVRIYNIYRAISHQETLRMQISGEKTIYLRKICQENQPHCQSIHLEPGQIFYERNERILWMGCAEQDKIGIREGLIKGKSTILDAGGLFSALHLKNFDKLYQKD
jgi:methionyl-tRNA formyltransferase